MFPFVSLLSYFLFASFSSGSFSPVSLFTKRLTSTQLPETGFVSILIRLPLFCYHRTRATTTTTTTTNSQADIYLIASRFYRTLCWSQMAGRRRLLSLDVWLWALLASNVTSFANSLEKCPSTRKANGDGTFASIQSATQEILTHTHTTFQVCVYAVKKKPVINIWIISRTVLSLSLCSW